MLNPKRMVEHLLATTYVRQDFVEVPADQVFFGMMRTYAPDVTVEMYFQEGFLNPIVTSRFPGIPLDTALRDVCRYCNVEMTVTDHGTIRLARPAVMEAMKRAVVIEPDPLTWRKVEILHVD